MSDIAIEVEHIIKTYNLYENDRKRALSIFIPQIEHKQKRVLEDISFKINKGESVAIIGKNGSGKSTLLKLITGVSSPDSGTITVNGQLSAIIEINSGFDLEFTGRENIYIKYSMLGYSTKKIKELEPKIIEFADLGEYIDQPVKLYSTGMRARLGFTIYLNTNPEILVVDEAFSVGDIEFREKANNYLKKLIEENTLTLVIVTHSEKIATQFCKRGILISDGKIVCDDKIDIAIEKYKELSRKKG